MKVFPLKLRDNSWHHIRGLQLDDEYQTTMDELHQLIRHSLSFASFVNAFYDQELRNQGKSEWAEKTPANNMNIGLFLDSFENARFIHICRNPYDTVASLVNRGKTVFDASANYLINTVNGLEYVDHPRVYTIRYEDIVNETEKSIIKLMHFLGLEFEPGQLVPDGEEKGIVKMEGWQYSETSTVGSASTNRFERMPDQLQKLILSALGRLQLKNFTGCNNIKDICDAMSYEYLPYDNSETIKQGLKQQMRKSIIQKTLNLHYYNLFNVPLKIN